MQQRKLSKVIYEIKLDLRIKIVIQIDKNI